MTASSHRPSSHRSSSPRRWLYPAPAIFVMAWGGNHFTPLLHMYQSLGGYTPLAVNLMLGLYVLGLIPALLIAGPASQVMGRKKVLAYGLAASAAGSVILAAGFDHLLVLCAGRLLAGVGVGAAMSVGTTWLKELSGPAFDPGADEAAGARRPAMALTLGFGLGAGVSGLLAQWGPLPALVPYGIHLVACLVAGIALVGATETAAETEVAERGKVSSAVTGLGGIVRGIFDVPLVGHRRFLAVVAPGAPWVFGAAGLAYAVMPQLVEAQTGALSLAYATLLTVLTLGVGSLIQPWVERIHEVSGGRAPMVGLIIMLAGVGLGVAAAVVRQPLVALSAAIVLGIAYGICIVAGLMEVQRIARPEELAGITGVYYALAYLGFLLPTVLAALAALASYTVLLVITAAGCAISLTAVCRGLRRVD